MKLLGKIIQNINLEDPTFLAISDRGSAGETFLNKIIQDFRLFLNDSVSRFKVFIKCPGEWIKGDLLSVSIHYSIMQNVIDNSQEGESQKQ